MAPTEFEPFGEAIDLAENGQAQARASKWLMRVGSALFWVLAGAIVIARAVYFEPGMFDSFARVVAYFEALPKG